MLRSRFLVCLLMCLLWPGCDGESGTGTENLDTQGQEDSLASGQDTASVSDTLTSTDTQSGTDTTQPPNDTSSATDTSIESDTTMASDVSDAAEPDTGPISCGTETLLCEGQCATCPSDPDATTYVCSGSACVVSECDINRVLCDDGVCRVACPVDCSTRPKPTGLTQQPSFYEGVWLMKFVTTFEELYGTFENTRTLHSAIDITDGRYASFAIPIVTENAPSPPLADTFKYEWIGFPQMALAQWVTVSQCPGDFNLSLIPEGCSGFGGGDGAVMYLMPEPPKQAVPNRSVVCFMEPGVQYYLNIVHSNPDDNFTSWCPTASCKFSSNFQ